MRLFWFALKQCLNAFQTLAPARLATPAAGPFLPQNGRKNFASPHCASLQNFAFILVQSPLKIALSCPFSPFPAFLHSSVPPRQHFITLHENSHLYIKSVLSLSQNGFFSYNSSTQNRGNIHFKGGCISLENEKPKGNAMEKLATLIVDKRNLIFLLYIFALIFCVIATGWVNVENDITTYLPDPPGPDCDERQLHHLRHGPRHGVQHHLR